MIYDADGTAGSSKSNARSTAEKAQMMRTFMKHPQPDHYKDRSQSQMKPGTVSGTGNTNNSTVSTNLDSRSRNFQSLLHKIGLD